MGPLVLGFIGGVLGSIIVVGIVAFFVYRALKPQLAAARAMGQVFQGAPAGFGVGGLGGLGFPVPTDEEYDE